MLELEFLPEWYPRRRRNRRIVQFCVIGLAALIAAASVSRLPSPSNRDRQKTTVRRDNLTVNEQNTATHHFFLHEPHDPTEAK